VLAYTCKKRGCNGGDTCDEADGEEGRRDATDEEADSAVNSPPAGGGTKDERFDVDGEDDAEDEAEALRGLSKAACRRTAAGLPMWKLLLLPPLELIEVAAAAELPNFGSDDDAPRRGKVRCFSVSTWRHGPAPAACSVFLLCCAGRSLDFGDEAISNDCRFAAACALNSDDFWLLAPPTLAPAR
jgi:hypothetical protein